MPGSYGTRIKPLQLHLPRKMELELALIFILRLNLTCQAFRVLAFSSLEAEMFNGFILSMIETTL